MRTTLLSLCLAAIPLLAPRAAGAQENPLLWTTPGHSRVIYAVALSPDGKLLASAGVDNKIKLWNTSDGTLLLTLKGRAFYSNALVFFPDGKRLASADGDGAVRIWDAATGAETARLGGRRDPELSLTIFPDGERLASAGEDGTVKVWGLNGGLCLQTYSPRKPVYALAYAPDGAHIFSGGADDAVSIWNASGEGGPAAVLAGHSGAVKALAASADGKYLASGGLDKTLKFWLTPWEAKARKAAVAAAEENAKNYELHYKAGLRLMDAPTMENLKQANLEFAQALSYRTTQEATHKLSEASLALKAEEDRRRALAVTALKALLAAGLTRKARARKTLPDEIKRQTLSGSYDKALDLYREFRSIGGDPGKLHAPELRDLYHSLRIIDELPKEDLPCRFLLEYSAAYAKDGNYRLAAAMLRSGKLADDLTGPADFDAFAAIHRQAGGIESLLAVRLRAETYSNLAEAFHRAGDNAGCQRACGLKEQFYPGGLSPRDKELLAEARKAG